LAEIPEKPSPRLKAGKWIGFLISAVFLYLAFHELKWRSFANALNQVRLPLLLAGVILYLLSYYFRGIRWKLLLLNIKPISSWKMTRFVIIGFMCNNILPARLGEFARALVISNREGISARFSFASVVLERVFDGAVIVLFLSVMLAVQPFPNWVQKMGMLAGVLFFGAFILLILISHRGELFLQKIQDRFRHGVICKTSRFCLKFVRGLEILKENSLIISVFGLSILIWGIEAANYLIVMRSLKIGLPLAAAAFTLVVANLGIMIPSSPGNIGAMQYFCILALSIYGISKAHALVFSLALHAEMYFPITILGIIFLWQTGLSLKNISLSRLRSKEMYDN